MFKGKWESLERFLKYPLVKLCITYDPIPFLLVYAFDREQSPLYCVGETFSKGARSKHRVAMLKSSYRGAFSENTGISI